MTILLGILIGAAFVVGVFAGELRTLRAIRKELYKT